MQGEIGIRREILARMLEFVEQNPREECCGLLAGRDGVISSIYPAENALHSPTAYEIAPAELFQLFRAMRAADEELLGIYHSHPHSENVPSVRDVERAYYPDAAFFILSPRADAAQPVRAFAIREGGASEIKITIA